MLTMQPADQVAAGDKQRPAQHFRARPSAPQAVRIPGAFLALTRAVTAAPSRA